MSFFLLWPLRTHCVPSHVDVRPHLLLNCPKVASHRVLGPISISFKHRIGIDFSYIDVRSNDRASFATKSVPKKPHTGCCALHQSALNTCCQYCGSFGQTAGTKLLQTNSHRLVCPTSVDLSDVDVRSNDWASFATKYVPKKPHTGWCAYINQF